MGRIFAKDEDKIRRNARSVCRRSKLDARTGRVCCESITIERDAEIGRRRKKEEEKRRKEEERRSIRTKKESERRSKKEKGREKKEEEEVNKKKLVSIMEAILDLDGGSGSSSFDSSSDNASKWREPDLGLGSQRDALYIVLPITIIYLSIFITGTIGNAITCAVIARHKSMRTATNYYLFNLAISDLLLLISGLPIEVYLVWSKYPYIFGEHFCRFRGLAAECSTNASVLTITAFTAERYVAICHPFLSQTVSKLSRAVKLILVVWLIALSFATLLAMQFGIVDRRDSNPDFVLCVFKGSVVERSFEISTFLFFVLPMIVITVLYVMIGLELRRSDLTKRRADGPGQRRAGKSSRRVLKMLVAVVVAFFLCWAPFHVQRLIAIYGTDDDRVMSKSKRFESLYLFFTYVSGVLYYVSTTINPILYNIMSYKFRKAFMETLGRGCGRSDSFALRERPSNPSLSRSLRQRRQEQRETADAFGSRDETSGSGAAASIRRAGGAKEWSDRGPLGDSSEESSRPSTKATNLRMEDSTREENDRVSTRNNRVDGKKRKCPTIERRRDYKSVVRDEKAASREKRWRLWANVFGAADDRSRRADPTGSILADRQDFSMTSHRTGNAAAAQRPLR